MARSTAYLRTDRGYAGFGEAHRRFGMDVADYNGDHDGTGLHLRRKKNLSNLKLLVYLTGILKMSVNGVEFETLCELPS